MNEDIVPVHDAIIGPFIATAVSKLFSSRFFGLHKGAALVLPLSPPRRVLTAIRQEREEKKPFQYF